MNSEWQAAFTSAIEEKKLHISPDYKELSYRFPSCYYDLDTLREILRKENISFQLSQVGESVSELTLQSSHKNVLDLCRSVFSKLNNLPVFSSVLVEKPFRNSNTPLVSCIILFNR